MNEDDLKLAKQMLAGRREACEEFFRFYFPRLYRFCLPRLNQNEDVAEEVAQQTLCNAIANLERYRGEASLLTWLYTLCRNELIKFFRTHPAHAKQPGLIEEIQEIRSALESLSGFKVENPDELLQRKQVARIVRLVLDMLPVRYSNVLEWKYMEGRSVKEIAGMIGVNPKAAESLLTRAREAFREVLASLKSGQDLLDWGGIHE